MIPEYLVTLGPFITPGLYLLLALAAVLACWLVGSGIIGKRPWRIAIGYSIFAYLAAVAISGVLS